MKNPVHTTPIRIAAAWLAVALATQTPAATFTVVNTTGIGPGSLDAAIQAANANPGPDVIEFAIPPFDGTVKTIAQTNNLTDITGPVLIDGYSQPGSSPNSLAIGHNAVILIQINHTQPGLALAGGGSTVRGLILNGAGSMVFITSTSNVVEGCFIGTDASGTTNGLPVTSTGVLVQSSANRIGGSTPAQRNLIGGCNTQGIHFSGGGASNNVVQGNYIGTDRSGTNRVGNALGVAVTSASFNIIGGDTVEKRNLISGNGSGVQLSGAGGNNVVAGNLIGTDSTGTRALPNTTGVSVSNQTNLIGGVTAIIGAPPGNVIAGNSGDGISLGGGSRHLVAGNYIGTDSTGLMDLGNAGRGILLNVPDTLITNNVISGNNQDGIITTGSSGSRNTIVDNFIGTDMSGTRNISNNLFGIRNGGGFGNILRHNVIAFNGEHGVFHTGASSTNNTISANAIYSNTKLGINLGGGIEASNGVSSNDSCDVDAALANFGQNHPILHSATGGLAGATISGVLPSAPSQSYRLEFFINTACDPSQHGEGEYYLGHTNVTTDATCSNVFTVTLPVAFPCGAFVTATATDTNGNTSEFSPCVPAVIEDTDGDGQGDPCELLAGTNPNNADSVLRVTAITREADNLRVAWQTVGGRTNILQFTLGSGGGNFSNNFLDLPPALIITGSGETITNRLIIGGATNDPAAYIRVRVVP